MRTYRLHDMGSIAHDDNFAVHVLRKRVSDQKRIREDSFLWSLSREKSAKRCRDKDHQNLLYQCLDARMKISHNFQQIRSTGSCASILARLASCGTGPRTCRDVLTRLGPFTSGSWRRDVDTTGLAPFGQVCYDGSASGEVLENTNLVRLVFE